MTNIHPTAIIDKTVNLGKDVKIGPYCVITGKVTIGDKVELKSHVSVTNKTSIGEGTVVYPFASIGGDPQDLKYNGEESELIIGKNNIIREHATLNIGTVGGGMKTIIGDNCLIMTAAHVAHDCIIGNNVRLSNNVTLGGHVIVSDNVNIGGLSAVHQFVRIGEHAMIGGMSGIEHDVMPYGLVSGERASLLGINIVGLKRRGFDKDEINAIRDAYNMIFHDKSDKLFANILSEVRTKYKDIDSILAILDFLQVESRGICRPKANNG